MTGDAAALVRRAQQQTAANRYAFLIRQNIFFSRKQEKHIPGILWAQIVSIHVQRSTVITAESSITNTK